MDMNQTPKANPITLILGIVGLVVGLVGGLAFGIVPAMLGLAAGVVGLVLSIVAKKNGQNATAGFVCSLLAIIFSSILFVACSCTACSESATTGTCYSSCGCTGMYCLGSQVSRYSRSLW